jgi:hypothetical protein
MRGRDRRRGAAASRAVEALAALLALVAAACASTTRDDASWAASGPMYRNTGGGYVSGSTTYHGSGGP